MDPRSGLCLGCLRTIDEITVWSRSNDQVREQILAAVDLRRQAQAPSEGNAQRVAMP
jgi:predicted Fe-S protein YdhL (DUF1289 family)